MRSPVGSPFAGESEAGVREDEPNRRLGVVRDHGTDAAARCDACAKDVPRVGAVPVVDRAPALQGRLLVAPPVVGDVVPLRGDVAERVGIERGASSHIDAVGRRNPRAEVGELGRRLAVQHDVDLASRIGQRVAARVA